MLLIIVVLHRKKAIPYNRASPQNSWSAGGDPLENPSGKEHREWDFAPYMDILPGVSSQGMEEKIEFGYVVLIEVSF